MNQDFDDFSSDASDGNNINIGKLLKRALKFWYIVLVCLIIGGAYGVYSYKTTMPIYKVSSLMLINSGEDSMNSLLGTSESGLPGISLGAYNNINNLIVFLTSSSHVESIIKKLNFSVSYFQKEMFLEQEIYDQTPFIVVQDTTENTFIGGSFDIVFTSNDKFRINKTGNETKYEGKLFEKIEINSNKFTVLPNEDVKNKKYQNNQYRFTFNPIKNLVNHYMKKFTILLYRKKSSVYEISTTENNTNKAKDFINEVSKSAIQYNLDKKNHIANNTIAFIDRQLSGVSDSLSSAERILEEFRSNNEVMDVSMQGQMIIQQSQDLEIQKAALMARLDYYKYLSNYIENNSNVSDLMAPSSSGVDDPVLQQLISELSVKHAEKSSLQFNSREDNPTISRINRRIETIKSSILESTKSIISTTNLTITDLNKRLMSLSRQIKQLPKTEQVLLGIERKFKFNDEMYTYLLERRSEAQLAKAASMADNEIIETATTKARISPNKSKIIIFVIVIGLILPLVLIFLILLANKNILDKEDVQSVLDKPFIGTMPLTKCRDNEIPFLLNPKSIFSESVRSIRTNLHFYKGKNKAKTILLTSSISGEGKTFCAVNIASSYAAMGNKTVLIGFDLRKPRLDTYFVKDKKKSEVYGLSSFLAGDDKFMDSNFILPSEVELLDYIPSGQIPPNPSELIASERTELLFKELNDLYDVIIIDTPPVGLVTDAMLLESYADTKILVVRQGYTPKMVLNSLVEENKLDNFDKLSVLLNGVPIKKTGYSYQYGGSYYVEKK